MTIGDGKNWTADFTRADPAADARRRPPAAVALEAQSETAHLDLCVPGLQQRVSGPTNRR